MIDRLGKLKMSKTQQSKIVEARIKIFFFKKVKGVEGQEIVLRESTRSVRRNEQWMRKSNSY